jgi:hypothetical protein
MLISERSLTGHTCFVFDCLLTFGGFRIWYLVQVIDCCSENVFWAMSMKVVCPRRLRLQTYPLWDVCNYQ